MSLVRRLSVAFAVVVATIPFVRAAEPAPTIEDVKKAWKARQEEYKSFRIEWVETRKIKKGEYDLDIDEEQTSPHPPEDHETTTKRSLAMDGDKFAGTTEGQSYYAGKKTWVPSMHAGFFDGQSSLELDPLAVPGWGRATIRSGKDHLDAGLLTSATRPILRFCRPLGSLAYIGLDFKEFQFSGRTEKIRGVACVKMVVDDDYSIWCDPERGYLPIRERYRYPKGEGYYFDWKYRQEKDRWLLAGWEVTWVELDGSSSLYAKVEVKKWESVPKFAADAFSPKLPPSSHITVYFNGKQKEEYLIRPDGSKRQTKSSERNKTYDELVKTNADGTPYVPPKK
jgi:hypothetical protein